MSGDCSAKRSNKLAECKWLPGYKGKPERSSKVRNVTCARDDDNFRDNTHRTMPLNHAREKLARVMRAKCRNRHSCNRNYFSPKQNMGNPPGKVQVHQNHFHQKKFFIKNHFHQKPLSSKNHFHQNATFIENHFHQKPPSSKTTFIKNHFHQRPLSSKTTFIRDHFHQKPISSEHFLSEGPTTRTKTT